MAVAAAVAGEGEVPDAWLDGPADFPPGLVAVVRSQGFEGVAGVVDQGRLRVTWTGADTAEAGVVRWHASTDAPGGWAARDWRVGVMEAREGGWEARVPLESPTVPVVYFLTTESPAATNASPMRVFRPSAAGVTEPTYPFSGFLEGFEGGCQGWDAAGQVAGEGAVTLTSQALSGMAALRIEVPAGRGSVTVRTVRLRGWMLWEHPVSAIRVAVRTESGGGRLRAALHSRSHTADVAVHGLPADLEVGPDWQIWEIPLDQFRHLRTRAVDGLSLQFFGKAGAALLVDDVEMVMD